jgi:hypothetical protein
MRADVKSVQRIVLAATRSESVGKADEVLMQAITSWADVAFSSTERDRHLGIRPVSQLNTWPVASPVNASRHPSRDTMHHSGSGRLAIPYPIGDFHLLFFASKTGALRLGSKCEERIVSQGSLHYPK